MSHWRRCGVIRLRVVAVVVFLALVAGTVPSADADEPLDSSAMSVLESMSDYVSGLETISLSFDSDIEVITPELEKIQFTNSSTATVQRPDKIHAHRVGGYADVEMWFDGANVSVYGRSINGYTQFELPGTLDHLIAALSAGHGVALPGSDLLLSNAFEVLSFGVLEAKHIGRGVIGGVECEHLAFRNAETDWQLWVEVGETPIPRKMVITSKTLNCAPQYTIQITSWESGVVLAADAFEFSPPPGAELLGPDALIELDELPQGAPSGGKR